MSLKEKKGEQVQSTDLWYLVMFFLASHSKGEHKRASLVSGPDYSSPFSARQVAQAPCDLPSPPHAAAGTRKLISRRPHASPVALTTGEGLGSWEVSQRPRLRVPRAGRGEACRGPIPWQGWATKERLCAPRQGAWPLFTQDHQPGHFPKGSHKPYAPAYTTSKGPAGFLFQKK